MDLRVSAKERGRLKAMVVAVLVAKAMQGFHLHAAGAAGRVVDHLGLVRVQNTGHQCHDRTGRVELTGLLVGQVGEGREAVCSPVPK